MSNTFAKHSSSSIGNALTAVGSYTVGLNIGAVVIGLSVSNRSTSQVYANVVINNGTNNYHLVSNALILEESTLVVAGGEQKIILQTGDSIQVNSSEPASVDAIMSIMETTSTGLSYNGINISSWTYGNSVSSTGSNDALSSIVYDGINFVAVNGRPWGGTNGNSGGYSADGINWTETSLVPDFSGIFGLAHGGGKVVAPHYTGGNVSVSSDNGVTWTKHANVIPDLGYNFGPTITSLAYGDGKFVAVEYLGAATYISTDGVTWTGNTRANLAASYNTGIRYGGGNFVVRHESSYDGSTYNFYHSTDGVTWTQSTQVSVLGSTWCYGYGNGTWIALPVTGVTSLQTGMRSTDGGHTWSNIALPNAGQQFGSVIHDGQRFIGVSNYNPVGIDTTGYANSIVSTDGITWSNLAMPYGSRLGGSSINNTGAFSDDRIVILSGDWEYGNARVLYSA